MSPRNEGEVDLIFTGRKAAAKQKKADEYAPMHRLYLASKNRRVTDDRWVAVGKQVAPTRWIMLSANAAANKWRDSAKRADARKQQYIAQGILRPRAAVEAERYQKTMNEMNKLSKMAPLIALYTASMRRVVADMEWVALRQQMFPLRWPNVESQEDIVARMRDCARSAYLYRCSF